MNKPMGRKLMGLFVKRMRNKSLDKKISRLKKRYHAEAVKAAEYSKAIPWPVSGPPKEFCQEVKDLMASFEQKDSKYS